MEASGTLCLGLLDWLRYGRIAGRVVVVMSAAQHTPGPWAVIPQKTLQGDIATVYNTPDGWVSIHAPTWLNIGDQQVAMANARLIAAAPDLLEALKLCEGNISSLLASTHPRVYGKWLDFVRAAIAKATEAA